MTEAILKKKGNPSKKKGDRWERDLAKQLDKFAPSKRIPGSGALGTILGMSNLTADVESRPKFFTRPLKIEAKYGYGTDKSMRIDREWMEKVRRQAKDNNFIPAVSIKFRDVTSGDIESAKWICFSVEDWNYIVNYLNELFSDIAEFWEWKYANEPKETVRDNNQEQTNSKDSSKRGRSRIVNRSNQSGK